MPINVFNTIDGPLATAGTGASGINDMGQIIGSYDFPNVHRMLPDTFGEQGR
jgi:uncharacterized membrane protein